MAKHNKTNGKAINGSIPSIATLIDGRYFIVATHALKHTLPPEERDGYHFCRPLGDFVEVERVEGTTFIGRWVQGMTVNPKNNGLKIFPMDATRRVRSGEIPRLMEILDTLGQPVGVHLAIRRLEQQGLLKPLTGLLDDDE